MSNYRIEEVSFGSDPSESCFLIIEPYSDPRDVADCCAKMWTPDLKRAHIVFDNRIPPLQVQACLKMIKKVMPDLEYIIKHAEPIVIVLMGQLWRRMLAYCNRRNTC